MNGTARKPETPTPEPTPVDIQTIRQTAQDVITDGAKIEDSDELETIIMLLRGMIMLLIPEVETATGWFPKSDIPAICARACVGESRMRIRLEVGGNIPQLVGHAQRLARSAQALADHYENLGCAK
ncbi:DUF6415 family natural product biosynthesis protein [Streptomyces sp. LARHCF252]